MDNSSKPGSNRLFVKGTLAVLLSFPLCITSTVALNIQAGGSGRVHTVPPWHSL